MRGVGLAMQLASFVLVVVATILRGTIAGLWVIAAAGLLFFIGSFIERRR